MHDNTLNQNVVGAYSQSADGIVLYFVPDAPLATGRNHTVSVNTSGTMLDLVGNLVSWCCLVAYGICIYDVSGTYKPAWLDYLG